MIFWQKLVFLVVSGVFFIVFFHGLQNMETMKRLAENPISKTIKSYEKNYDKMTKNPENQQKKQFLLKEYKLSAVVIL